MNTEVPQSVVAGKRSRSVAMVRFLFGLVFGVLVPLALLAAGAWGAMTLIRTAPQAERNSGGRGEAQARLVETRALEKADVQVLVEVMGLVQPARRAAVQPRVSGEIEFVSENLEEGGLFRAGETLLELDPTDYELVIRQLQAQVAQAQSALEIEMGQQDIARAEFELLGGEIAEDDHSLVLREPQLARARADLDAAKAALENAQLDLKRTVLSAPFNSMVIGEDAERGVIASASSQLVDLVGTDAFHVELSVPVDDLRWIEMPTRDGAGGSTVRVFDEQAWGAGLYREGVIVRFTPNVDPQSRMATLTVRIEDPLGLQPGNEGSPPLLLNSYVRAEVDGRTVPGAFAIERHHIHDGDTVWIMDKNDRLDVRRLALEWKGRGMVLVTKGLRDDDRLVTTKLSAPVQGMRLRTVPPDGMQEGAANSAAAGGGE